MKKEELELLKLMANNARMPIVEMSGILKSTPMKVMYLVGKEIPAHVEVGDGG
mgnify:CR=1 FL=1